MHIHILGICGTFMGGIALIAKAAGHQVSGCDLNVYPPMSTELEGAGIEIMQGFGAEQLSLKPDLVVVGNVMKRGMPVIERLLNEKIPYVSGPQWLYEHYLKDKEVLAVAGTHGKTTTTAMLAWILECAGLNPGFLIGGVPENFAVGARASDSPYFVIEADEYDCAFFDKRSKFVHYRPVTAVLNNLEYDHADIFASLEEIKRQFHHLVRTIPGRGHVVVPQGDAALEDVLSRGLWSGKIYFAGPAGFNAELTEKDGSGYVLSYQRAELGTFTLPCCGVHNVRNALAAIAAASTVSVEPVQAAKALETYKLPKRRLELKAAKNGCAVYDDFAHHPTAVLATLEGLRAHAGRDARIIAVFEPRSNSMKQGANSAALPAAFAPADEAVIYQGPQVKFDAATVMAQCPVPHQVFTDFGALRDYLAGRLKPGTVILTMSNGSFNGLAAYLADCLQKAADF